MLPLRIARNHSIEDEAPVVYADSDGRCRRIVQPGYANDWSQWSADHDAQHEPRELGHCLPAVNAFPVMPMMVRYGQRVDA